MLIGVTGRAQHGKDSIGQRLVDKWGFTRFAFADGVREMALVVDPVLWSLIDGSPYRLSALVADVGWDGAKQYYEVRRILQKLGTEGVRDIIGPGSWVQALDRKLMEFYDAPPPAEDMHAVVTDVRFPNEAEYIHRHNGVVIRVIRPGFGNGVDPNHPSEKFVPNLPVDFEVSNDGDLTDLAQKVDAIAADVLAGFGMRKVWR